MEILFLILIAIVIFMLMGLRSKLDDRTKALEHKLDQLVRKINQLAERSEEMPVSQSHQSQVIKEEIREEIAETRVEEVPPPVVEEYQTPLETVVDEEKIPEVVDIREPILSPELLQPKSKPAKTPAPSFFERHPDMEKFIGENLANKIGIAILVLGIGFFVKYAIDQNWIGEIGRVMIGVLAGGALIGVAHRLRKTFVAFSSVLVGGGIAVLYFTIAIAFHEYQIFSQTAAFLIMVVITMFTVLLSLGYNRVELAVLAILGGFGSPFMVSTGEGNYVVLFSYLTILNAGMLGLAYYKKWRIVNYICYAFTILIFGSWLSVRFDNTNASMVKGGLLFATIFYFLFFLMNVINNIRQRNAFEAPEIFILLSNTFLYYAAGMTLLMEPPAKEFQGLFTIVLGIFNFIFAFVLYKNQQADRKLVFMLIGLVLTFVSLAAPVQLEGNYITLFWSAEAVLLLWLSQKSGIKLMKIASIVVMALMLLSLLLDWKQIYVQHKFDPMQVILNKGYITGLFAIVSMWLYTKLLSKEEPESLMSPSFSISAGRTSFALLIYLVHLLELRYQLSHLPIADSTIFVGIYNMFMLLLFQVLSERAKLPEIVSKGKFVVGLFATVAYLLYYNKSIIDARYAMVLENAGESVEYASGTGFHFHYVMLLLAVANLAMSLVHVRKMRHELKFGEQYWWVYTLLMLILATTELTHASVIGALDIYAMDERLEAVRRVGYTILWGVSSFILIIIGINKKIKMLRIISLSLMSVTLLKLFIFDLRNISEGGKIVAFILLGVILLVVSFLYQRLKKLLLEDEQQQETKDVKDV